MNFMNMITSALTSGAALQALSAKTGLSEKQLKMIIMIAIPLLLRRMTSNASSQNGANSLLGALTQHQNREAVDAQLENADAEDGSKIVGHILGDDRDSVVEQVAKETDVDPKDVNIVLGNISPTIMNGLSAATETASTQQSSGVDLSDGFDLSDVMGLLGGMSGSGASAGSDSAADGEPAGGESAGGGLANLFGSLLGASKPEQDQNINGTQLIQSLLSMMK